MKKKALMFWGGWDGHEPKQCTEFFAAKLQEKGFEVEVSGTLDCLNDGEKLKGLNLIVPSVTCGQITDAQCGAVVAAVQSGVGLGGWHGGMGDAFRASLAWQYLTGSQFLDHPGNCLEYTVNIKEKSNPIVQGIPDFRVKSEQYYMHVDPGNHVLATTEINGADKTWLKGVVMPQIWTRKWGEGKVFYAAPGHNLQDFKDFSELTEIIVRGMAWAAK